MPDVEAGEVDGVDWDFDDFVGHIVQTEDALVAVEALAPEGEDFVA